MFYLAVVVVGYFSCVKIAVAQGLNVAIIGGGIGGSAAAYNLNKLVDDVQTTIFEVNAIGGRLKSVDMLGRKYEAGGAILISRNRYMVELLKELNLEKRKIDNIGYAALYDGEKILFAENEWRAVSIAQLLWRYGMGIYSLNNHIGQMLDSFDRIYSLQEDLIAFENVTALLFAMNPNFVEDTRTSSKDGFLNEGFSPTLIDELVAATLRVNYGQSLAVHKFVGSVSVAGAAGGLWAVEGGNQRVAEELVRRSGARVVMRAVKSITRLSSGKLSVGLSSRSDIPPEDEEELTFDAVIVAAPQTEDMKWRIDYKGFDKPIAFHGQYHRTICTLLKGELRHESFPGAHMYTDEILTTTATPFFNSVSRVYPVDGKEGVNRSNIWKVFSQNPLKEEELSFLFRDPKDISVMNWLAYPQYNTESHTNDFVLGPQVYHINAIEWAASAMEMSLIGARNVANLLRNHWCLYHKCSPLNSSHINYKEEL